MKLSEAVGMATAIIGTLVSVLTLVLQQRQRSGEQRIHQAQADMHAVDRWEADHVASATNAADERAAREEASRRRSQASVAYDAARSAAPARRRRSYKAIASAVLGVLTLAGALLLALTADLTGEPVTSDDTLGVLFYGVIAVLLALSARRDVRSDPGRRGGRIAWTGIGTAVLGGIIALQAPTAAEPPTAAALPNLRVAVLDNCSGYRVANSGTVNVGGFQVMASDSSGSLPFTHAGLGAGQMADTRFPDRAAGTTTVVVDSANAVRESDENDNVAQLQC
jgi:CARDB